MNDLQIREHIAKAIQDADEKHCPDSYADANGFGDHAWLSDWGAFLADAVKHELREAGYDIVPKFACEHCKKRFRTAKDKQRHRNELHTPHLKLSSKDRPARLGDVECGHCEQSFANEHNAAQHRRDAHGINQ